MGGLVSEDSFSEVDNEVPYYDDYYQTEVPAWVEDEEGIVCYIENEMRGGRMSKERELLQAALDFLYPRRWVEPEQQQVLDVLTRDIEELLAQPEYIPDEREPLSDGEITDLWANKSPANEFECVRLVEKAHGIGVEQ